jgi:hypothetical protein
MLANFQHPPGAEARSFITSLGLSLAHDLIAEADTGRILSDRES